MAVITVAAFPRDGNPYQRQLATALHDVGVGVRYLAWPTGSHTLNLLLLPLQLIRVRAGGVRVLHLHWMYPFVVPGLPPRIGRRLAAFWYTIFLNTARAIGLRIVWTAHNVLPHQRLFTDDRRRRQQLIDAADAIVVHSAAGERALRDHGLRLAAVVHAPHGPYHGYREHLIEPEPARTRLGIAPGARVVLFFGRINPYKGVTDLLEAWPAVVDEIPDAVLLVAGACDDADLRFAIENRAGALGPSVRLLLEPIAEELIPVLFSAAEFTCLPFRSVTTSGSAILAAGLGRLLIPELQTLGDVAGAQVARYQPGPDGLREGLVRALREPPARTSEPGPGPAPEWTVSAEAHAALFRSLHLAPASPSHRTKGTDVASAA